MDAVPPRRLRIVVSSLPIEDGATRPPAVGEVDHYRLTFREVDEVDATDDPAPMLSTIRARAEPLGDGSPMGPGRQWDGTPHDRPTTWPTTLHGDGWSAWWSAPRPVIGEVRLRGVLADDLDIDARGGVRGRVERVRLITETIDTSAEDQRDWRVIPAERRLRDVDVAPGWFDRGLVRPDVPAGTTGFVFSARVPADPYVVETGVLVDLDLDHVPPLPPRPSIVPGSVDASGPDLWVADTRLPLVVRIRRPLERPEVTVVRWTGRILGRDERRTVHADPDGCWLTGPDGVHRVDAEHDRVSDVRSVDASWVGLAATAGRVLLIRTHRDPDATVLRRHEPDGTTLDVDLGDRGVLGLVAGGDEFVVMLSGGERRRVWPATIGPSGTLREGPDVELRRTWERLVAGDPVLVRDGTGRAERLRPVHDDLTLGDGAGVDRMLLGVVGTGGRLWATMHPPHPLDVERRGAAAYWPLTGPPAFPDERPYRLLAELDPSTLAPVVSSLVLRTPDRVAVDGTGTVWVLADGVRHLPHQDGAAATVLDVAALLDRSAGGQTP